MKKAGTFRVKSSVVATVATIGFLAAATVGGEFAVNGEAAEKGDRFAVVGERLCGEQAWPNITAECVAWRNAAPAGSERVRYITVSHTDRQAGVTELRRVALDRAD